jgi:hypothetical protein
MVPAEFGHLRLSATERKALLNDVLDRCQKAGHGQSCIVFDLDGTLMDNRPRVVQIMHELAEHWQGAHPAVAKKLEAATVDAMDYGVIDNMQALGIEDAELHKSGLRFWMDRFFVDEYLRYDTALAGAVRFATACYEAGANLCYLTGRDTPNMALGSFASLRDLGFPIGVVGTELVTKPDFETADEVFKTAVANDLHRLGEVVAAFDNEPGNCNLLLRAHPNCLSVLLDTLHAPGPPELAEGVLVIDHFEHR